MFKEDKIILAKSVIFNEDFEKFLDDIIELKFVTIEVGMGLDKFPYFENDSQQVFLNRLSELKRILVSRGIPLKNIRLHVPVGARYEAVFPEWKISHKLYNTFSLLEEFILKANRLGFRAFVIHPASICVEMRVGDKSFIPDPQKAIDEYYNRLRNLQKNIGGTIYMEYVPKKSYVVNSKVYRKFLSVGITRYKDILRKTGIQPLLDTGVFESIEEFKIAKSALARAGFPVKAIHIQQDYRKAHHFHLTKEQFRKIVNDFAGVIVDEGFYKTRFAEGQLHAILFKNQGDINKHTMPRDRQMAKLKGYFDIIEQKGKLHYGFRLR
jgi:hypothetical protein